MTEVFDDATNEPLLTHAEVVELQHAIEAGLLARDARGQAQASRMPRIRS